MKESCRGKFTYESTIGDIERTWTRLTSRKILIIQWLNSKFTSARVNIYNSKRKQFNSINYVPEFIDL